MPQATYKARPVIHWLILRNRLAKMYILTIRRTSDETKSNDEGVSSKLCSWLESPMEQQLAVYWRYPVKIRERSRDGEVYYRKRHFVHP